VHEEKSKHYITIFNEIMGVSLFIYGQMALLINENDNLQEIIGWYLASIITGVVAINVVYTFAMIVKKKVNQYCKKTKPTETVKIKAERLYYKRRTMITQATDDSEMVVEDYDSNDLVNKSNVI
jgi:phosphate/sulfate permease